MVEAGDQKPKPAKVAKKKRAKKKTARKQRTQGALVIVESPAKCRTIEKILGRGYEVRASMGHIIDLPKSKMGVDLENGFEPKYIVMVNKRKVLTQLKKIVKKKKALYLACDPDREGEAISWHLGNELGKDKEVYRVRFQEITRTAVTKAFENPISMDMNKVGAQQARRILDRIVGYSLSPLLWQSVAKGLSAGRVQSVALRLIVDQENKIKAFVPEEYWSIDVQLKKEATSTFFEASLEEKDGKRIRIDSEKNALILKSEIEKESFVVDAVRTQTKRRQPQAPLTTSKLQQEAYNRFKMRPTRTMAVAQSLYEGVALGDGETVGLITYMRTDSVSISAAAMEELRAFIPEHYGEQYLSEKPNQYKSKKSAQEAHEAIRPTSVLRTPASIGAFLNEDQLKIYGLIWSKVVSSQMKPALFEHTSVNIKAGIYMFKASGQRMVFSGFLEVWKKDLDQDQKSLPELHKGDALVLGEIAGNQHFTKPPPRFTDASLVKALEEEGIGRPSTYAPIIQTIVSRNYVERQGGSLRPIELGFLVVKLLVEHFPTLMDVGFTARMEEELDQIEEGSKEWVEVLRRFYGGFSKSLDEAKVKIEPVRRVEEKTDEICELCSRPMVIKWGRRGKFMSCSGFPECRNAKSIPTKVACPECKDGLLVSRRAKSGRGRNFYGCSRYPECNFITNKLPSENTESTSTSQTPESKSI